MPALRELLPTEEFEFWQRESFDHIVRGFESLERINAYIRSHETVALDRDGTSGGSAAEYGTPATEPRL